MTSNLQTRYFVIALVLALAGVCIGTNWPINLGIDLRGGSILTYRIERLDDGIKDSDLSPAQREQELSETLTVIAQRINKEGVKDISVQQEGDNYIVVTLPNFGPEQTRQIRNRMTQMGALELPIVAQAGDNAYNVSFDKASFDKARQEQKAAYQAPTGFRWYPKRPERMEKETDDAYKARIEKYEADRIKQPWTLDGEWLYYDQQYWDPEVWKDSRPGITGRDIFAARRSVDSNGGNAVVFDVREDKQTFLASYTSKFIRRGMAMVLNGEVWSVATIQGELSDNVQITRGSGGYSKAEQSWLLSCLQAGSLKLKPVLESTEQIGATLGAKAIERGEIAFIVGGIAVVGFMLFYYGFAGMLAVVSLVLNFVMVFAILMLLQASLTLPGLAGLVLTIGMSVDANILIFERIREEVDKGKKLIHAAKNGFDRAFVTIFDANLTTFIVALFLVWYGQGPIKGFGYTLMAGIICSMFAALYIVRTLLGTALARNWVTELKMRRVLDASHIDFLGSAKKAMTVSSVFVVLGLLMFVFTGREKYALDFNGGTAVRMVFQDPISDSDVKSIIADIKDEDGKQKYNSIDAHMIDPENRKSTTVDLRLDHVVKVDAATEGDSDGADPYELIRQELAAAFTGKLVPESVSNETFNAESKQWSAVFHFKSAVDDEGALRNLVEKVGLSLPQVTMANSDRTEWRVEAVVAEELKNDVSNLIVSEVQKSGTLELSNPLPKVRFVGPQVVADLKESAFQSMFLSLLFILGYIWFRFKELKFGVAASVALVHDVLISLGMVILFNMSGIVSVPISLDVIAAFLTIIGYSLNDTIIVFDRIRENLGSTRGSYAEIINKSINQTLSRTLFTSMTTFFVIAAIFVANVGLETPLQGLSFTLLVGVLVGTYSSIFVASPILVWFHNRELAASGAAAKPGTSAVS